MMLKQSGREQGKTMPPAPGLQARAHLPGEASDHKPASSPPGTAPRPLHLVAKRTGPRDGAEASLTQDPAGEHKIRRHKALRKIAAIQD